MINVYLLKSRILEIRPSWLGLNYGIILFINKIIKDRFFMHFLFHLKSYLTKFKN